MAMSRREHERAAAHHATMAQFHAGALRKAEDDGGAMDGFDHEGARDEHLAMAEHHLKCAKAASGDDVHKADGFAGDRIQPDLVSMIAPPIEPGVRPIPRAGQREIGKAELGLDDRLAELVKIE